jgi:hypothetical protein
MIDPGQVVRKSDSPQVPTQLEVLRGVVLSAGKYGSWMTLVERANKTKFPEASISEQLRHMRKPGYGAFHVDKRRRAWEEALRASTRERVWEYQVRP